MFNKIFGLFKNKYKVGSNIKSALSGYVLNEHLITLEHPENNIIIEIDEDYSFSILYMTFSLLKHYLYNYNITFLILLKDNSYLNNIKEILKLLYIKNFIFIDNYNFEQQDMQIVYLNKPIIFNKKNILFYNFNFMNIKDLELDLLSIYLSVYKSIDIKLNITSLLSSIYKIIPNLGESTLFNFTDSSYIDIFKLDYLLKKYPNTYNVIITKNNSIYSPFLPGNTIYIDLETLLMNKSKFYYDLFKFVIFIYAQDVIFNTDYSITFLSSIAKLSLHKQHSYKLLYNNSIDPFILSYANNLNFVKEYTITENNITSPLKIAIFTRVTRIENLNFLYENIEDIFKQNNATYVWFLIFPVNKVSLDLIPKHIFNNSNIVILNQFISFNEYDKYDSGLMNVALMHKALINCQFLYVLDDDNLLHPNFIKIIRKNIDKYIIVNKIELSDSQRLNELTLKIENPNNLTEENCVGNIDFANVIFNINALHYINGFNLEQGSGLSDGATVQEFLKHNIMITYSNEYGGYYNRCS